jgi:S-(hydroxymethyl)glutathione dehydrogenase/alcohol dehydrogenase
VLVEIKASGVCHTDEFTRSGADPEGLFPVIFGHEGAGVVVEVGRGVTSLKAAITSFRCTRRNAASARRACHARPICARRFARRRAKGVMPDGSSRFSIGKDKITTTWAARRSPITRAAGDRAGEDP